MSNQHLMLHSSGHLKLHTSGHLKLYTAPLTYNRYATSLGQDWYGYYNGDVWSKYTADEIKAMYASAVALYQYRSMWYSGNGSSATGGWAGQTSYANAGYTATYVVVEVRPSSGTTIQTPVAATLNITASAYSNDGFNHTDPSLSTAFVGTSDTAPTGDPRSVAGNIYSGVGAAVVNLTNVPVKKYIYWGCFCPSTRPSFCPPVDENGSGGHAIAISTTWGAIADG